MASRLLTIRQLTCRAWIRPLALCLPLCWLFRRALFAGEMFAFRDAAHYYFPFYHYINQRWLTGVPLWNPLDGIGQPLLGDPTAAVLYPGKLLFLLPCSYPQCFAVYIVSHLLLGGWGASVCARQLRAGHAAAIGAGFAYELSGQVLFQYCNPIFAVGAAWLPWAVLFMDRIVVERGRHSVLGFAVVLSMMVFGGDPQMAYHVMLIAGLRWLWSQRSWMTFRRLSTSAVLAIALSAVQVLPSYEWAARSDRAIGHKIGSMRHAASSSSNHLEQETETLDSTAKSIHVQKAFDFSVGPWRWPELCWPNISGRLMPTNGRWISKLPAEGRTWTPTLYLGVAVFLLSMTRLKLNNTKRLGWMSWTVVLSILAALGKFGFVWLVDEFRHQLNPEEFQSSPFIPGVGGLYWLMTVVLPGYASFRYPAKWWTVATLFICLLAAKGFPALCSTIKRRVARSNALVLAASLIAVLSVALAAVQMEAKPNTVFGPLQPDEVAIWVVTAIVHTGCVLGLVGANFQTTRKGQQWILVLLFLMDLMIAQRGLIHTTSPEHWQSQLAGEFDTLLRDGTSDHYPEAWQGNTSTGRLEQLVRYDVDTLYSKHHLSLGKRSLQPTVAMSHADWATSWNLAREEATESGQIDLLWLQAMGLERLITDVHYPNLSQQSISLRDPNIRSYDVPDRLDRFRLVPSWSILKPIASGDPLKLERRTREVWLDGNRLRGVRSHVIIETDLPLPGPSESEVHVGSCHILKDEIETIVIEADVLRRSVLVMCDQFYPGWYAQLTPRNSTSTRAKILRVNRMMRGILLEPGEYQIELTYRPRSVRIGFLVSSLSWLLVFGRLVGVRSGRAGAR